MRPHLPMLDWQPTLWSESARNFAEQSAVRANHCRSLVAMRPERFRQEWIRGEGGLVRGYRSSRQALEGDGTGLPRLQPAQVLFADGAVMALETQQSRQIPRR